MLAAAPPLALGCIHLACVLDDHEILRQLVDSLLGMDDLVAEINRATDHTERTPAYFAAKTGSSRCLQVLIESGLDRSVSKATRVLDLNKANFRGDGPVHVASDEGKAACLELLIEAGADLDRRNEDGQTAVWLAVQSGEVECLELLVAAEADLRAGVTNGLGHTEPLGVARETQQSEAAATLALATLDFDASAIQMTARSRWLQRSKSPPLARMLSPGNVKELTATVTGQSLEICLPYAFARFPLDTCVAVIKLVHAYRQRERVVTQLDQRAGAGLLEAAFKAQQILVAILSTLDDSRFTMLMLPMGGHNGILEDAICCECKVLLSYERLQKLLYDRWRPVLPGHTIDYVKTHWYGEMLLAQDSAKAGGQNPNERKRPGSRWWNAERQEVNTLWIILECVGSLLTNLLLVLPMAAYPPLQARMLQRRTRLTSSAKVRVRERNPPPGDFDDRGRKRFYLDGVLLGTTLATRTEAEQEKKYVMWSTRLAHLCEQEGLIEMRFFPLFQPAGKYVLHTFASIVFAFNLMNLEQLGESRIHTTILLTIWALQIVGENIYDAYSSFGLYRTDVINSLELTATMSTALGLIARLHVRGPRTMDFLRNDLPSALAPAHVINWALHPASVSLFKENAQMDAFLSDEWITPVWERTLSQALIAVGVGLLMLSEWCRLLQRSATFGPLVLMALEMIQDVVRFITLLAGVFFAFAVSLVVLFKNIDDSANSTVVTSDWENPVSAAGGAAGGVAGHAARLTIDSKCDFLIASEGGGVGPTIVALLELMLGSGPDMSTCLHASTQSISAPIVMVRGMRA